MPFNMQKSFYTQKIGASSVKKIAVGKKRKHADLHVYDVIEEDQQSS